ncbi:MAG: ABC transporter substrate-binding protein [Microcoleaceae cyanobacterium]
MATQPVTITFMMIAGEARKLEFLVDTFEAENPGIRIDLVYGPRTTNLVEDLYTGSFLLGDSPYDIVYSDIIWASKFAAAGWLRDLSPWVTEAELKAFMSASVEGGRVEGGFYWMPFVSGLGMLYYRTDLLAAAGLNPPETFEDLITESKVLQEKGLTDWGYVWQGFQYEGLSTVFLEMIEGFGGFWIDDENQIVGLDQPQAIEAATNLRRLIDEGISPDDVANYVEYDTLRLFRNGKAAFLRNWPFVWQVLNQPDSELKGKIAIKPMVHAPGQESGSCMGGWGFSIAAQSPHPEAAWKVVQFFSSERAQRQFILASGYVPVRRSLFTDPEILEEFPHYPEFLQIAEKAVLRPPIRQYAQVSDILQRYLSGAITGQMTPEEAMTRAAGETRRTLGWTDS